MCSVVSLTATDTRDRLHLSLQVSSSALAAMSRRLSWGINSTRSLIPSNNKHDTRHWQIHHQLTLSLQRKGKKGKGVCIAIYGNPSHNYGVSLAIWDHTVLPSTRHKRTHPHLHPSQTGWYSLYRPFKDGGLSKPRPRVQRATGPQLLSDSPGQLDPNPQSIDR